MSPTTNELTTGTTLVPLEAISTDEAGQTRVKARAAVVKEYATAMTEQVAQGGLRFPPVVLFTDGASYWLGDGFHRVLAARKAGFTEILAKIETGTQRDALLYAISANIEHGLPRTNADKRKAVALLLADAEWSQWSDREIAKRCRVNHNMVGRMRRGASGTECQMEERKTQRGGVVYEMNVGAKANAKRGSAADSVGIPVPEARAKVFMELADFDEAKELLDRLAELLSRIAQGPGGELYRQSMIRLPDAKGYACPALRTCRDKLLSAQPYCCCCPLCHRTNPMRPYPTCKSCGGRGWTTRAAFEACNPADREYILQMRQP